MARQMTAQTDLFVDPATIAADVFNVDFSLTSADALLAQLENAVSLEAERNTLRPGATQERCACPASTRLRADAGPYATAALAAQVLHDSASQLSMIKPIEDVREGGCDYRTILTQIRSSVAAIVKELNKPEPLDDLVKFHLNALSGSDPAESAPPLDADTVGGDLGILRKRLGLKSGNECTVSDERTRIVFSSVVQFTSMVGEAWRKAKSSRGKSLTLAMHSLQRSLRGIAVTAEELRQEVPSSAWITYQIQNDPPIIASDLYQWIHDQASAGALNDLKQGGKDGIRNVHDTMFRLKTLVERRLRVPAGATDPCKAAFADKDVQLIVEELICHMKHVVDVTANLK
jgi:hypothetical protein